MKTRVLIFLLALFALQAQGIRIVNQPYLQDVGASEVTIVWTVDKPSVGWVELAPDDGTNFYYTERPRYWNSRDGIKQEDSTHVVHITGLKPGTRYRYRVYSQEVLKHEYWRVTYGNIAATDVFYTQPLSFCTLKEGKKDISFCIVNDIHGDNAKLENLLGRADVKKQDFVIFNGDMVSSFNSRKQVFDGFMNTATRLFASEIPMYYTRGNHETRGTFAPQFHHYFSPSRPKLYYTLQFGSVFFVMLDTGEDKPDTDLEYSGITDYDAYRTEESAWLEQVVASEAYRKAPFRIIIAHIPPETQSDWHGTIEVQQKFVNILSKGTIKPDVMFCGHTHVFAHHEPNANVPFPVIVNSNKGVVTVKADEKEIKVRLENTEGKVDDQFTLKR